MIPRRKFLAGLATLYTAAAVAPSSISAGRSARVGILSSGTWDEALLQEFIGAMHDLGWVEGRNIIYERVAVNGIGRTPEAAKELVSRNPDLIVARGGPDALVLLARTRTIPIVFWAANDPIERGIVASLPRPGGNVTGVANIGWELGGKRMQLLREAVPGASRVGVLTMAAGSSLSEHKLIRQAAGPVVEVVPAVAKMAQELDSALASLASARIGALMTTHTPLFLRERKRILNFAARARFPVIGHRNELADDGALLSYSSALVDQVRRSAHLVDKVLKGTRPADIPVEQPTKFELVVNVKTAKALGIKIPEKLLLRADRVIE
ncbi:MAG: ABC transporter substrate-binding protein [Betaproteobacteria bacterium]|nr:ABC transporter substrate-binding protein [Betaproteobacteria bacterium]